MTGNENGGKCLTSGQIGDSDFISRSALSEDYLSVPDARIRKIESVLTLLGGKVVHAAAPFSQLLRG